MVFVVPAKAAAVVAEVTMKSRCMGPFAVNKVMSDLLSGLSSSGWEGLFVFIAMSCLVRVLCPVME